MEYPQEPSHFSVRFRKTGQTIQQTFMDLVAERSFAGVSIIQVCNSAGVSRQTFYEHYPDKFTLLEECLRSILIIPNSDSVKYRGETAETRVASQMRIVAEKCASNRGFLLSVTEDSSLPAYANFFFDAISEGVSNTLKRLTVSQYGNSEGFRVKLAFARGGVSGALRLWIAQGSEMEIDSFCGTLTTLMLEALGPRKVGT